MKSVKEENGVNRKAANLDRLSKENLSEEVTFVQVRKQTMQRPGLEGVEGGGEAFQAEGRARTLRQEYAY